MLHKKGNVFHNGANKSAVEKEFRSAIANALRVELGGTNQAAQTVMKWVGISERTAKNWISETHSPSCEHLIDLMKHSDAVFSVVLGLAGRNEALTMSRIEHIKQDLENVLADMNVICGSEKG